MDKRPDRYQEVLSLINSSGDEIPVPYISSLFEVDAPTINNRICEKHIPHTTRRVDGSRTNFVSKEIALEFARIHQYALKGWITFKEAGVMTGIRPGTIKARYTLGRLEGHVDLTKRTRVNPDDVEKIKLRKGGRTDREIKVNPDESRRKSDPRRKYSHANQTYAEIKSDIEKPPKEIAEPPIRIITAKDYGLPEREIPEFHSQFETKMTSKKEKPEEGPYRYNPSNPPSIQECKKLKGKSIIAENCLGTIIGVLEKGVLGDTPQQPVMAVQFPDDSNLRLSGKRYFIIRRN